MVGVIASSTIDTVCILQVTQRLILTDPSLEQTLHRQILSHLINSLLHLGEYSLKHRLVLDMTLRFATAGMVYFVQIVRRNKY